MIMHIKFLGLSKFLKKFDDYMHLLECHCRGHRTHAYMSCLLSENHSPVKLTQKADWTCTCEIDTKGWLDMLIYITNTLVLEGTSNLKCLACVLVIHVRDTRVNTLRWFLLFKMRHFYKGGTNFHRGGHFICTIVRWFVFASKEATLKDDKNTWKTEACINTWFYGTMISSNEEQNYFY